MIKTAIKTKLATASRNASTRRHLSIGFIGLGQMGKHMASNLIKKLNHESFYINDHSKEAALDFQKLHPTAKILSSPLEIAEKCSIILTMLPASPQVKSVYLGDKGLLSGLKPTTLVIDSSTIDPSTTKLVFEKLKAKGVNLLDAPVSGGTSGAELATLTFMVGAESEHLFTDAKVVLQNMGKNVVYCGTIGNGQMLLGISMIGTSEAMHLGVKMGMDPKLLANIINTSSGRCWSSEIYNPCPGVLPNVPAARDYTDMGLAVTAANETKSTVLLGALAHQVYNQAMQTPGYEKKDFSSIFKWLR